MTDARKYDNSRAQAHAARYREDPEAAHLIHPWGDDRAVTTLVLTTRGRRSGRPHATPLIYREVDGDYVVVASLGGAPTNPAWYFNLTATPECTIQVERRVMRAVAHTAGGEDRERLWAKMVELYPDYDDYQRRTQRQIPVVVLEPRAELS